MRLRFAAFVVLALGWTGLAEARQTAVLQRIDAQSAELVREDNSPVAIWLSEDTDFDEADRLIAVRNTKRTVSLPLPAERRLYVILREADGGTQVVGERLLPLEQGSNFRDIGGYPTKDGKTVRWGKVYRSGALPLLTDQDYALIGGLGIDSIVDLRSLEERTINADQVDEKTGALFLVNDYSMRSLFTGIQAGGGENIYKGMEHMMAPQYRAIYRRILAQEGAVLYHCSAGQDRTGVATALLYDMLGVERETILKDYHLSTEWRRPDWEMPKIDPKDFPDNPILQYYVSRGAEERMKAEPLYTRSGASHLAQFFTYLDAQYGGSAAYMKRELGLSDTDLDKLRTILLEQ